ncbi:MAG: hypothetical protein JWM05_694 [Acidimicrobiales bacterium]|nr:hypothetical protein [Acidimicrobiales bacterium]
MRPVPVGDGGDGTIDDVAAAATDSNRVRHGRDTTQVPSSRLQSLTCGATASIPRGAS